jgi:ssDNA-binding Zn-finger/Zn-ribbon topoisomerase 1
MTEDLDRRCPWCGSETLVRDGTDERCTARECLYLVEGKYAPDDRPTTTE